MPEAARLVLIADSSSLRDGETALDSLARTGGKVEGTLKISAKGIEQAMARIATVMGGLDTTMLALQRSVTQSMGRASQEVSRGARSFDELRRSIDPAYAASERFADVQQQLAGHVATGAASQAQANSVLEIARSRYLGVATAAEAAEQAQREMAAAVAQTTGSYEALRNTLDPVYASSKRYEAAVETANTALRAKIITEGEHARVLQMAQTRYLALTPAVAGATSGLARFTPQITNASFQIQDFAVQVASGQSALTAFTQQFPQLAGALGASGQLALLGAGLGTVVAVGAALLPLFMSMGNAAKAAEDAVSDLNSAFSAYKSAIDGTNLSVDDLTTKFGSNAEAARVLYTVMRDLAELELAQAMGAAVAAATSQFGGLEAQLERINSLSQASIGDFGGMSAASGRLAVAIGELSTQYGLGYGQAVELNRAMQALENAKGPQEQARAAAALVEELRDAQRAGATIPPEIMATAQQLAQASMLGLQLGGNLNDVAGAAANAAAAARDLASALAAAAGFSMNIDNQIDVIGARIAAQKAGADAAIAGQVRSMQLEAAASRDRQIAAGVDQYNAEALYQLDLDRIAQLGEMTAEEKALAKATNEAAKGSKKASSEAGSAAKKAATEAEKLNDTLDQTAQRWRETLDPMARYRRESEELAKLTGRLSSDEMAKAQRNLNIELADSLPLVGEFTDTMTEGLLNGFKGTLSSIGDMMKRWLANMIAMAAKNRIMLSMGFGGGAAGMAGGAMAGQAGGALATGGVMAGIGALGGGIMSGLSGGISALGGGLGSAMQYTQFMAAGATSGMAGLGAAIGAIALPVAALVGVFSFFRKSTKELDSGLRLTVDGMDTLAESFSRTETRRFWGLSKRTRTSYDRADEETQDALSKIVGTIQTGVLDAAAALGVGSDAFAGFAHEIRISTKGMTDEEAQAAIQDALGTLGDEFAAMVPGLKGLAKDGETTTEALQRLSSALLGVNAIMDTLGHSFLAVGITGADMASKIADAFGGMDAMASATQSFYQTFYSDAERLAMTTRQTTEALARLGIAMPRTRDQYRQMVAALDLTTAKGREAYAMLIGLSDSLDMILPTISALTAELAALQDAVQTGLDGTISAAQDAAKANATAAANWYKAAGSIREYIDKLRGTASALFNPAQALRYNRQQYNQTYRQALNGDLTAAQNVGGAADRYLSSVMDTARTREEAALAQARVLSQLGFLQGVADVEGARHDVIAGLIGRQVELLEQARDFLANGGVMTAEMIATLRSGLGSINGAIAAAQRISVAAIMRRLNVTVDVIADADIPPYVRNLLSNATNGIRGFVDFIVRSDLSPDQKWLALQRSSTHLNTVNFLARNQMSPEYTRLALREGSNYRLAVTSHVASGSALNTRQLQQLFTGNASGTITLGGSFRFDPSAGFATWYETASRSAISTPMAALRTAMGNLQAALTALRSAILTPAPAPVVSRPAPTPAPSPAAPPPSGAVGRLSLSDYRFRQTVQNSSGGPEYYTTITGPNGGTRRIDGTANQARFWVANRNYPRFERGGQHVGGLRIVGEKGPELEATGPSRIFSNSQSRSMLDNSEVVQELRAVRAELAEMQAHARRTAESTRDTFKTLREINSVGVKIDPVQNKVSA
ncbi:hypothetical protein E4191_07575 [Paracoccus liaowanqingii]|uniref:Bacteriophage tail tape measure N-terminal domain-containing protein n=1 Tax=Paracoccus liaowanqingii TaxID=2560053 RepID=A0A4P7HKF0_9RHOB|nr:hypothetical protein [Paracoccus liaowanqingii]QBX34585.1 hypothetical protein E4191_07575 [Paracoccus liaowanqingii]